MKIIVVVVQESSEIFEVSEMRSAIEVRLKGMVIVFAC